MPTARRFGVTEPGHAEAGGLAFTSRVLTGTGGGKLALSLEWHLREDWYF
jgi:hypothetical protein